MKIIPAIDMIDGKCVRLEQGVFAKSSIYHSHPLEAAKMFEDEGFSYLHLVDLDGARSGESRHLDILKQICSQTRLKVDFSGGLKDRTTIEKAFENGASQVMIGSLAVKNPDLMKELLQHFGPEKIILSADLKDYKIAIRGWEETTEMDIESLLQMFIPSGLKQVMSTNVSRDGMMQGCDMDLYKNLRKQFPALELIASGGISSIAELEELESLGVVGAILGKSLYEKQIGLKDLKPWIN